MNIGQRFSVVYLDRGSPAKDSRRFRNRLRGYFKQFISSNDASDIVSYLIIESGMDVPWGAGGGYMPSAVFEDNEIRDVLDSITLIYKFFITIKRDYRSANRWRDFVERSLREENVGYRVDENCGVHYFVDEEFERNRYLTLNTLDNPELRGVKTAFEDAYKHLDADKTDAKASVRSMFEAIEILTKLLCTTNNLNSYAVKNLLKPLAVDRIAKDDTEKRTLSSIFDGFAEWVDGMHNYRHGQGKSEPVEPSEDTVVYVLSSGSSFLRLLIEVWKRQNT